MSTTAEKHHENTARGVVGSESTRANSESLTEVEQVENVMSQDAVSFTEAEGGPVAAVSSSLTRSSKDTLSRGEEGRVMHLCQFH